MKNGGKFEWVAGDVTITSAKKPAPAKPPSPRKPK